MTVAEFIDFLKTQDQAAHVRCIEHSSGRGYYDQGGNIREVAFDPAKHVELTDFTSPAFAGQPYHGTKDLLIGSRE